IDTGLTLAYLMTQLAERAPRSLDACALLDRPSRRIVPQTVRYCGATVGEEFLLGYGLHYRDVYRNLPFVIEGDAHAVSTEPMVYVGHLYGPQAGVESPEPGGRVRGGGEVP